MTDQNNALIVGIARIIDHPSVYMGGPSRNSMRIAETIVKKFGADLARADRAAPEGQVRAKIEGLIEDAIANAEVDYPAGREAGHSITWDSDRLLDDIIAAITPPPAAPTDNTALVEEQRMKEHYRNCWKAQLERANGLEAALASREAPPACQQEAVTVAEDDILADAEAAYWADPNNDSFDRHCIRATLRALKGERG